MGWVQYFLVSGVNHKRIKENAFLSQTTGNSESISLRGQKGNTCVAQQGCFWHFVGVVLYQGGLECPRTPKHGDNQNTCTRPQGLQPRTSEDKSIQLQFVLKEILSKAKPLPLRNSFL